MGTLLRHENCTWRIAKRLSERKATAMTIAIGMLCQGGAIVCADTKVIATDNSVTKGQKLYLRVAPCGSYVIADAANDANAALTLIRRIMALLDKATITSFSELDDVIRQAMTKWSRAFAQVPSTQLIVASSIKDQKVDLCFCEPPNTIVPMGEGYISIGGGTAVTDPLFATLFKGSGYHYYDPQRVMRMMAYLMGRAKQDSALCGGSTHVVYVRDEGIEPLQVNGSDFALAETRAGALDFLLKSTATLAMFSEPGDNLKRNAEGIGQMMIGLESLRATVIHDVFGEVVKAVVREK